MNAGLRALDVAAPSAAVDRLAPWMGPSSLAERALFWTSFHGLSTFAHVVVLALVAVPLVFPQCAKVQVVPKPPVRVEMAIMEVEADVKPPPPPAPAAAPAGGDGAVKEVVKPKPKRPERPRLDEVEMLRVLGALEGGAIGGVLSTSGEIDNALGGIVAPAEGSELRGLGGAAARGEGLGLGSVGGGSLSRGGVTLALEGAPPDVVRALARTLASCRPSEVVRGVVVVKGERVVDVRLSPSSAAESCVTSRLRRTLGLTDGTWPITVTPR